MLPLILTTLCLLDRDCPRVVDLTCRQRATLRVGQRLVLRLPCDHGEPCRWEIFDRDGVVLTLDRLPRWEDAPGGGGRVQVFRLTAVAPGRTTLRAIHASGMGRPAGEVWIDVEVIPDCPLTQ